MDTAQIIIISVLVLLSLSQLFVYIYEVTGKSDWKIALGAASTASLIIFIFFTCLFIIENNKKVKTCPVYEKLELTVYKLKE